MLCKTRKGDKIVNIATIISNLLSFIPKGALQWERVLILFDEVEKAVNQLKVFEARSTLKEDHWLVLCLLGNLDSIYQEESDNL